MDAKFGTSEICAVHNGISSIGFVQDKPKITIIVACHQVIGSNGSLTGYAWGTSIKAGLLELEQAYYCS